MSWGLLFILMCITIAWVARQAMKPRAPELARKALLAIRSGDSEPCRRIAGTPAYMQVEAYLELARLLAFDGCLDQAWEALERAAALDPGACLGQAEDLGSRSARPEAVIRICQAAVEKDARVVAHRVRLGDLLLTADRTEEALALYEEQPDDPLLAVGRAEALLARGHETEAREMIAWAKKLLGIRLGDIEGLGGSHDQQEARRRVELLSRALTGELRGAEAEIEDALVEGRLDPNAPVNLTLIGKALMVRTGRVAVRVELGRPEDDLAAAQRRLKEAPDSLPSLCLLASALLRQGRLDKARVTFEQIRDQAPDYWPASLGLGAAMRWRRFRLWQATRDLELRPRPPGLEAVVPDWPALSEEERRVVLASVWPLRFALPVLAARGVRIRILPIDVRPSDLEELAWVDGVRSEDHHDLSTASGLATHGVAVARIEELLDTVSEESWTFAHELAHLVFFHLPVEERERVEALYRRALEIPHATEEYQARNVDEFFAVSYERWMGVLHDRPRAGLADAEGVGAGIKALFEELAERD